LLGAAFQGLADAFNALGNIGADLPPAVREKAQKVVISAIIVTQIATQAATMAAQSAAAAASASAAGSGSSSSSTRRKE
jgi:hypothetical protein